MPILVDDQAPVPPPPYYRMQARFSAALHIDALTLVSTLHLLTLCRLAVCLAHHRCLLVQEGLHGPTAMSRSCSLPYCAPCGGSPTQICGCWSCPSSVPSPVLAGLSRAYLTLSRLGLACLLSALPGQRP